MKKSKLISVICLLLMFSILAASCAESTNDPVDTKGQELSTEGETEPAETTAFSTVPVNNYEGATFAVIITNQDERHVDFVSEEQNGDILNDLVFARNSKISEVFNIIITAEDMGYDVINNNIQKDSTADDCSYSLYVTNVTVTTQASAGYCYPVYEMPGLNLSAPYWDQDQQKDMSIGGNLYMCIGDICPTELLTSECVLFNKRLFDDHSMTYPYDLAFNGTWTLDKMIEYTANLTEDLNGDGKFKDSDDLFSYTLWSDGAQALSYGAGINQVAKDEDDLPYLNIDINAMSTVYEKIYDLLITNKANYSTTVHEMSFKVFNEGRAYFCGITFQKLEKFLRDMEDNYGVLPMPKASELQERYQTCVSGAGQMIAWPTSVTEPEMIGNVTDALAAYAYDTITPKLYNVIVGVKNVRDEESAEIMNMIIRNRIFSIAHMYGLSSDGFTEELIKKKSTDVASYMEKKVKNNEKVLQKLIDAYTNKN